MASEPAAPDWYSHGLNRVAYYRLATVVAAALPRGLGRLLARVLPAERRAVRSNLGRVLADASPVALGARVRETFANFGAFFADLLALNRRPGTDLRAYVASAEGEHHLDAAIAAGRLLSSRGARTAHVVLSAGQDASLERYLRLDSPQLRFGDAIVPFFGEPAAFPLGPFVLARAAGAAVIPAFWAMVPGGRHRLEIDPPIWVKPGEERAGLTTVVAALERVIRADPTRWFNFFDAWSPVGGPA